MTDTKTVDDILEHFGVKGMKWGVRNDKKSSSSSTSEEKSSNKKKAVAAGVAATALIVGAGTAAYILNKNGKLPIKNIKKTTEAVQGAKAVKTLIDLDSPMTKVSPTYDQYRTMSKSLPDNMFLRFDNNTQQYVMDAVSGWNPNTNRFGKG